MIWVTFVDVSSLLSVAYIDIFLSNQSTVELAWNV